MQELWKHQIEAVERASKSTEFALFHDVGCLAHDSEVKINRGGASRVYTIEHLYRLFNAVELRETEKGFDHRHVTKIRAYKNGNIQLIKVIGVYRSGFKPMFKVTMAQHNHYIKATADHKVLTQDGWKTVSQLSSNDFLACDFLYRHKKVKNKKRQIKHRYKILNVGKFHKYARKMKKAVKYNVYLIERHRAIFEAHINKLTLKEFIEKTKSKNDLKFINPKEFHIHHKDQNTFNNDIENLECLTQHEHFKHHGNYNHFNHGIVSWRKVKAITPIGEQICYDIETERPYSNFVANNIVVHNCGKSRTLIEIIRNKINLERRKLRTLIVAPVVVCPNWVREIKKFSKIDNPIHLKGTQNERIDDFKEALRLTAHVFIINYEFVHMKTLYEIIKEWRPEVLVLDESHRVKGHNTHTTKQLIKIADNTIYRYLLSGTPILNKQWDIWGQFRILDKGKTFGQNFFQFRNRYFYDKNAGMPSQKHFPDWRLQPSILFHKENGQSILRPTEDVFHELIYKKAMRVRKEDCLDLPPLLKVKIPVELSSKQKKLYNEMKQDFLTYVEGDAVVASMALTKALRMQQIITGFVKTEKGEEIAIENPRLAALESLLEDNIENSKIIVWACFHQNYRDIEALLTKMKISFVSLTGLTSSKDRQKNIDAFQNDPKVRVMLASQSAAGEGITLTVSNISIYYSRNFNLKDDIQSEARNHRAGSNIHDKVTRYDLVAENTIDEHILEALQKKIDISESILSLKDRLKSPNKKGEDNFSF